MFKNEIVTISILTFNRRDLLEELLSSLFKISYKPLEIVVVDNGSSDGTDKLILKQYPIVKLFRISNNIGVEARNIGMLNSKGNIIITLDDDIIGIDYNSIIMIVNKFLSMSFLGALCFKVIDYYSNKVTNWCHPYKLEDYHDKEFLTTEITEGAVAFRRNVLEEVGYYPKNFFISNEGSDLACRILNKGYDILYFPNIIVSHKYSQKSRTSWRRYYFDTRNQFWFAFKNYHFFFALKYLIPKIIIMFVYSIRDGFVFYWFKGILTAITELPDIYKVRSPISKDTEKKIMTLNKNKPGFLYMFKKRFKIKKIKI